MNVIKGKVLEGKYQGRDILVKLGEHGNDTRVSVDGKELKGIGKISIHVEADKMNTIRITTI